MDLFERFAFTIPFQTFTLSVCFVVVSTNHRLLLVERRVQGKLYKLKHYLLKFYFIISSNYQQNFFIKRNRPCIIIIIIIIMINNEYQYREFTKGLSFNPVVITNPNRNFSKNPPSIFQFSSGKYLMEEGDCQ